MQEKLYHKAKEYLGESLDILGIVKKLQEVDKLKRILLNDDQLFFFNLLNKPLLTLNQRDLTASQKLSKSNTNFTIHSLDAKQITQPENIYKKIKERSVSSDIDKRILFLLDEDMKLFLEKQKN